MYIENLTELAFDDVPVEDPDFPFIQGHSSLLALFPILQQPSHLLERHLFKGTLLLVLGHIKLAQVLRTFCRRRIRVDLKALVNTSGCAVWGSGSNESCYNSTV